MIDYIDTMQKIGEIIEKSRITFSTRIEDRNEQLKLLNCIFGNNFDESAEISHMSLEQTDGYAFLTYESKSKNSSQNLVIIRDNKPLFRGEYIENFDFKHDASYYETINTIYRDGTSKIENRIIERKWMVDDIIGTDVDVTEVTILNFKDNKYSRHNYTLYSNKNKIISFKNHNQIWLECEQTFEYRLNLIKNNILKVQNVINDRLNYILSGEDVKKYEIKRKNIQ